MRAPARVSALLLGLLLADPAPGGEPPQAQRVVRPGDIFLIEVPDGTAVPESVVFFGQSYPPLTLPGRPGSFFLLGVDLEADLGRQPLARRYAGGRSEEGSVTVVARLFPEERLTLPPALVTPPPELEERILREQALAAEVYRTSKPERQWDRGFLRPLDSPAAGNFGRRRILNGIPKSPHSGQDYSALAGTPVRAVAAGRVRLTRDFYYSGLTVLVDHGAGVVSQYLHLEKILVAEGETVARGQVLGRVGSTGRATGPHLHFGLRLFEKRVDPELLWNLFESRP